MPPKGSHQDGRRYLCFIFSATYVVVADIGLAYVVVVYIVMADVVVACVIMAYIVMAYVVLARMGRCIFRLHPSMLERGMFVSRNAVVPAGSGGQHAITSIGISASPTAYVDCGYGRASTQNDRLVGNAEMEPI